MKLFLYLLSLLSFVQLGAHGFVVPHHGYKSKGWISSKHAPAIPIERSTSKPSSSISSFHRQPTHLADGMLATVQGEVAMVLSIAAVIWLASETVKAYSGDAQEDSFSVLSSGGTATMDQVSTIPRPAAAVAAPAAASAVVAVPATTILPPPSMVMAAAASVVAEAPTITTLTPAAETTKAAVEVVLPPPETVTTTVTTTSIETAAVATTTSDRTNTMAAVAIKPDNSQAHIDLVPDHVAAPSMTTMESTIQVEEKTTLERRPDSPTTTVLTTVEEASVITSTKTTPSAPVVTNTKEPGRVRKMFGKVIRKVAHPRQKWQDL